MAPLVKTQDTVNKEAQTWRFEESEYNAWHLIVLSQLTSLCLQCNRCSWQMSWILQTRTMCRCIYIDITKTFVCNHIRY